MTTLFDIVSLVGPLAAIAAMIVAIVKMPGRHALMAIYLGALLWIPGCQRGIVAFCQDQDNAGNLCGLGGVFGTGPLTTGAGIILYILIYKLAQRYKRRQPPRPDA